MRTPKEYIIQFVGLSVGEHLYDFHISDKFFESLDYSEIKQGDIIVKLTLLKQSSMMILHWEPLITILYLAQPKQAFSCS